MKNKISHYEDGHRSLYPLADILRSLLGDNPLVILDDYENSYHFFSDPELEHIAKSLIDSVINNKKCFNKIKALAAKKYSEIDIGESEPTIYELCYIAQTRINELEALYEAEQSIYR